jgi:hypothetical protein
MAALGGEVVPQLGADQGACRVCMEECDQKLVCKCNGFAHTACIQEWNKARIQRGDSYQDALHCELCKSKIISDSPSSSRSLVCSWCRIQTICVTLLGFLIIGYMYSILTSPNAWDGIVGFIVFLALITALFIIKRFFPSCIPACFEGESERWEEGVYFPASSP